MKTIDIRRSVRSFKDMPVEKEKIEAVLRAGMQAPSAANQRPWEFLVVSDPERRQKLADVSQYAKSINHAPTVIIVLANKNNFVFGDYFPQDLGACSQNILLEAVDQGLGAVWLGIYPLKPREYFVTELFDLPEHIIPFGIIPIGYPEKEDANQLNDRFDQERIHYETY